MLRAFIAGRGALEVGNFTGVTLGGAVGAATTLTVPLGWLALPAIVAVVAARVGAMVVAAAVATAVVDATVVAALVGATVVGATVVAAAVVAATVVAAVVAATVVTALVEAAVVGTGVLVGSDPHALNSDTKKIVGISKESRRCESLVAERNCTRNPL